MRSALILSASLSISACGTSRMSPAMEPEADVPHVALTLDRPAPEPYRADVLPIEAPPPVPEAPRGSIQSRAVYPDPGYVEWVLANGVTVVHKQVPGAEGTWLYGFAPESGLTGSEAPPEAAVPPLSDRLGVHIGVLGGEHVVAARAPTLADALSAVTGLFGGGPAAPTGQRPWGLAADPPASTGDAPAPSYSIEGGLRAALGPFTFVFVSADASERVEALVGGALGTLSPRAVAAVGRPARADAASPPAARFQTGGARREAPALDVLAAAVRQRLGGAGVSVLAHVHPRTEVVRLEVTRPGPDGEARVDGTGGWLAPFSEVEVRGARLRAVAAVRAGDPAVWAGLLADLYREAGSFRPARNPAELSQYADRLAAVSTASVNALAARLRSSSPPPLSR